MTYAQPGQAVSYIPAPQQMQQMTAVPQMPSYIPVAEPVQMAMPQVSSYIPAPQQQFIEQQFAPQVTYAPQAQEVEMAPQMMTTMMAPQMTTMAAPQSYIPAPMMMQQAP